MADTITTQKRLPNPRTSGQDTAVAVEISLAGEVLGSIAVPQEDLLSKKGNVLYRGGIRKGWMLPGDPAVTLAALAFKVNGIEAPQAQSGVHLSTPTVRNGKAVPNTGGELTVRHFLRDVAVGGEVVYMANIATVRLKAGPGNALRINLVPQGAAFTAGPQVTGEVDGLLIEEV